MRRVGQLVLRLALLGSLVISPSVNTSDAEMLEPLCLGCHSAMEGRLKAPTEHWQESIHKKAGLSCEECHGGASIAERHASDPSTQKPPIYRGKNLPGMCARCHTDSAVMRKYNLRLDQYALYKTTAHWRAVSAGNTNAATCVSCHGIHGIKQRTDPASPVSRMNVPNTCGHCHENPKIVGKAKAVVAPYRAGVHGQILQGKIPGKNPSLAPVCTDCHGVHRLHAFASPEEEVTACATCHSSVAKQFRQSLHARFLEKGQGLRCTNCHDPHNNAHPTEEMFEGSKTGHCGSCHVSPLERPLRMAAGMKKSILDVSELIERIEEGLEALEHSGRFNDDWKSRLEDIQVSFKDVGPVVHSLDLIKVKETAGKTKVQASNLHQEILSFQESLWTRRLGLYMALGIIFLNIVIVYLKLRTLSSDEGQASK